ncbi:DUF4395 family protein [Blastococcus mobilis]|uniref:DUF4395 domain-containing protein n=1 Tax=Blastococcus mobilis TaxID=1938746 RepID=A0A238WPL8_9ACTN|nr:DUF4395 family protein [Blastococcus mobilis]SNR48194.1 protein of unknown function [Blastococcus mobilis]
MSSAVPREVDVRGPRFAAWVTAVVLAVALVLNSGTLVAAQAAVFALVAALLGAATGICLGCESYLLARRALPARA